MNNITQQAIATLTRRLDNAENQIRELQQAVSIAKTNNAKPQLSPNDIMQLPKQQARHLGAQDWLNKLRLGDMEFFRDVETEADNEQVLCNWITHKKPTISTLEVTSVINNHFNTEFSSHDIGRMVTKAGLSVVRTRKFLKGRNLVCNKMQARCIQVEWRTF